MGRFLGAATEDQRVAALEACHDQPLQCEPGENGVDLFLGDGVIVRGHADKNAPCGGGGKGEDFF